MHQNTLLSADHARDHESGYVSLQEERGSPLDSFSYAESIGGELSLLSLNILEHKRRIVLEISVRKSA